MVGIEIGNGARNVDEEPFAGTCAFMPGNEVSSSLDGTMPRYVTDAMSGLPDGKFKVFGSSNVDGKYHVDGKLFSMTRTYENELACQC